ncbi:hypothetical protein Mapa_008811 [Marchantia paleacea]|nr:hypothetical protein Mapa_008811 [Marchantia paleacea]
MEKSCMSGRNVSPQSLSFRDSEDSGGRRSGTGRAPRSKAGSFVTQGCKQSPVTRGATRYRFVVGRLNMAAALAVSGVATIQIPFVGLRGGRPSSNASFVSFTSATNNRKRLQVQAFFDVQNDPIVKEALKEPVAFLGGVFAGILRLDLNEEPLREWVAKTAEAAGVRPEDPEADSSDDLPNEIAIE